MYVQTGTSRAPAFRAKFDSETRPEYAIQLNLNAYAQMMLSVAEAQQLVHVLTAALTTAEAPQPV